MTDRNDVDVPEYPQPAPPEPGSSKILDSLVDEYLRAKAAGDHARANRLRCWDIPEAMAHSNQGFTPDEYVTASGVHVSTEESIRFTVPAGKRKELYEWLAEAGHTEVLSAIKGPFENTQRRRAAETAALKPLIAAGMTDSAHDLIGITRTWRVRIAPPRKTG